jgi:L-amino acid N-acyltransferase YncA
MPRAPVAIRDCGLDDLAAVQEISAHYALETTVTFEEETPSLADWQARWEGVAQLALPFLVAEADGRVLGYAYCTRWRPRPAYRFTVEDSVYVAPDAGGRGIGTFLLRALLDRCRAAGVRQVLAVIAAPGDVASVRLHERCGFTEAGRLTAVGFKHGRWLDTVLMQCGLGDPDT